MNESKNFLFVIDNFYPFTGGAEKQGYLQGNELTNRGHHVVVLTRNITGKLPATETLGSLEIIRLNVKGNNGFSKIISMIPGIIWSIRNVSKYDHTYLHGANPFEWSVAAGSKICAVPYYIKLTTTNFFNYAGSTADSMNDKILKRSLFSNLLRYIFAPVLKYARSLYLNNAKSIFAITPLIYDNLIESKIRADTVTIFNGVDISHYSATEKKNTLRKEYTYNSDDIIFIYTGRLTAEKNLMTILKAWKLYQKDVNNESILLLVGGDNNLSYSITSDLKDYINSQGIKNIIFTGDVPDTQPFLQISDYFILPSFWEGMSNSLLEAMSCGLVPLVSNIPANKFLISDASLGYTFDPNNHKTLFNLMKMVSNKTLDHIKIKQNVINKIKNQFSIKAVVDKIEENL